MIKNLKFEQALDHLKYGERIAREGWNGKSMFVFLAKPNNWTENKFESHIHPADIFSKEVREFLRRRGGDIINLPYLCMYTANGEIVHGWLASQSDILANDWCLLDSIL